MNSRERIKTVLEGNVPDRLPVMEAFWKETIPAWEQQGLPAGIHPAEYFELDVRYAYFIDVSFRFEHEILEETDDYFIESDPYGRTLKILKDDATPMPLSWAVKDESDWEEVSSRLKASEDRISMGYFGDYFNEPDRPSGIAATKKRYDSIVKNDETFVLVNLHECCEAAMLYMGDENVLMSMAMKPELIKSIFDKVATLIVDTLEILFKNLPKPDGVFFGGDLAYKNAPLFSPQMYRELLKPAHTKIFKAVHDHGLKVIYHTDGHFLPIADDLIDAGIDAFHPLEAQAGIIASDVKEQFQNRAALIGNIAVPEIVSGGDKMKEELERKLSILMKNGGYIYHSDHSIPPTMKFDDYVELQKFVKSRGLY